LAEISPVTFVGHTYREWPKTMKPSFAILEQYARTLLGAGHERLAIIIQNENGHRTP